MLSEVGCPKDNPTQSKHPYPRPTGWDLFATAARNVRRTF